MTRSTPTASTEARSPAACCLLLAALLLAGLPVHAGTVQHSVARQWNEALLEAIRNDFARPIVHARNLFHTSVAMWDAWAAYDGDADAVLHAETASAGDVEAARQEAISHAAFRLLTHRFASSPGNDPENPDDPNNTLNQFRALMTSLGYDPDFSDAGEDSPRGLGVRIANTIIAYGLDDGANEINGYSNTHYAPANSPLDLDLSGNPGMSAPNRWQPLQQDEGFVDQSGHQVGQAQTFLGAEWGLVRPFALDRNDLDIHPEGGGWEWWVYHDPGLPPQLGGAGDAAFKDSMVTVIQYSGELDPAGDSDGDWMDISPASLGDNSLGTNDGDGYDVNPYTGQPYEAQWVRRGDYFRVIAEYWADGPASETPPGHWFTLLNDYLLDSPVLERRIGGAGPELPQLEWDVKAYLALGGAVHDAAVSSWSIKGYHDGVRPISAIRHMAELGQSSDSGDTATYHPEGLPLVPGLIEVVTAATAAGKHAGLPEGEIAILAWQGHGHDPETETSGVGWILAKDWWPYQQKGFVTPPFAGYVSGHSTFSRAAAEVFTLLTGDEYFPGGLAEFCVTPEFLEFEDGPTQDLCLQWARYYDASDQSGISRIYGGIHPPYDDLPGRIIGHELGTDAWQQALKHFNGTANDIFNDAFAQP